MEGATHNLRIIRQRAGRAVGRGMRPLAGPAPSGLREQSTVRETVEDVVGAAGTPRRRCALGEGVRGVPEPPTSHALEDDREGAHRGPSIVRPKTQAKVAEAAAAAFRYRFWARSRKALMACKPKRWIVRKSRALPRTHRQGTALFPRTWGISSGPSRTSPSSRRTPTPTAPRDDLHQRR